MAIDYLQLFGDDFDTVLNALDDLTPAAERVLLNSLDNMVFDAQTFSTNIQKQISTMTSSGMSRGAIASSLNTDMKSGGRIFGQLKNNIKSGVVEGVQETAKLGQYDNYDLDKGNFAWVTVGGHKVCADCDGRAGDVGTFNYHETEGLPGAGWSVCQAYCYCVLDPTGKLPKKVQGVPVREKRAGVPRAPTPPKWKPSMTTKEARAWNAESAIDKTIFHGTTKNGAKGIRKTGFDSSSARTGQIYGRGGYGTSNVDEVATAFAGADGEILEMAFNVKNPLTMVDDLFDTLISGKVPMVYDDDGLIPMIKKGFEKYWTPAHQKMADRKLSHFKMASQNTVAQQQRRQMAHFGLGAREADAMMELMSDMGGKWMTYLDDLAMAGDAGAISILDDMVLNSYHTRFNENFGDTFTNFLQSQNFDGLIISEIKVPHVGVMDTYYIAFEKEAITAIVNP